VSSISAGQHLPARHLTPSTGRAARLSCESTNQGHGWTGGSDIPSWVGSAPVAKRVVKGAVEKFWSRSPVASICWGGTDRVVARPQKPASSRPHLGRASPLSSQWSGTSAEPFLLYWRAGAERGSPADRQCVPAARRVSTSMPETPPPTRHRSPAVPHRTPSRELRPSAPPCRRLCPGHGSDQPSRSRLASRDSYSPTSPAD